MRFNSRKFLPKNVPLLEEIWMKTKWPQLSLEDPPLLNSMMSRELLMMVLTASKLSAETRD